MKVVAEIGSNWHTLDDCIESVKKAKKAGADAVKFQFFDSLYGDYEGPVSFPNLWDIADACEASDIELMCTLFRPSSLILFDRLIQTHKIASSNMEDKDLISAVLDTGKPFYLSTGGHTLAEVEAILKWMDLPSSDDRLTLMYCESVYPAYHTDWRKLAMLKEFGYPVGLSDHSLEVISNPQWAAALCLPVIEKHVNLIGATDTADAPHSLSYEDLCTMVSAIRNPAADVEILDTVREKPMRDYHNARPTDKGFYRVRP